MRFCKYILLVLLAAICLTGNAFGAVRVRAQVDSKNMIYVGERFPYYIVLDGVRKAGVVDMSALDAYSPQYTGGSDRSQTSITIINGKRSEKVSQHYVMSYSLMPMTAGVVRLGGVDVTVSGQVYRTNEVLVNIVEPERTDRMDLVVELSKAKCYAGEAILMTVRWFIRNTIAETVAGVEFNVPVLQSSDFYIEEPVRKSKVSGKLIGLKVNGVQTGFAQRGVVRKGLDWVELSFGRVLIAKRSGSLRVEDVILSVDLAIGKKIRSFFGSRRESKRFFARSEGKVLEVLPVPEEGKPSSFYGLVGKYRISTSSDITQVDVGQPIELTISIGGKNYLTPVRWPKLEEIVELSDNFRISGERDDGVVKGFEKVFKTTIRAANDSVSRIPPISLSYFDVDKEKYVTTESSPIALEVRFSEVVTFADAEMAGIVSINRDVEAVKKGMAANYEDMDLVSEEFSPVGALVSGGFALIWFVPFAGFVISAVIKAVTYRDEKRVARKRRRQALGRAVRQLKKSGSLSVADFEREGRGLVAAAMRQYVGERFDKTAGSLTGTDCDRIIAQETCDAELAGRWRQVLEECEAAAYSGMSGGLDAGRVGQVIEMVCGIEKAVRR